MKKTFFSSLMISALLMPAAAFGQVAVKITPAEKKMAEEITAGQLSNYLYFVASDAMGGRDTPSATRRDAARRGPHLTAPLSRPLHGSAIA